MLVLVVVRVPGVVDDDEVEKEEDEDVEVEGEAGEERSDKGAASDNECDNGGVGSIVCVCRRRVAYVSCRNLLCVYPVVRATVRVEVVGRRRREEARVSVCDNGGVYAVRARVRIILLCILYIYVWEVVVVLVWCGT